MVSNVSRHGPLKATFYQLGLNSEDPARLASFYSRALGYQFAEGDGGLGIARDRRVTIHRGAPKTLAYAAYAVPDADELRSLEARLTTARVRFDKLDMDGFQTGVVTFNDPDGNCFRFGVPIESVVTGTNPVSTRAARIQHVVFASTDLERMLPFFTEVVGFTLSDRVEDDAGGLRTFFVRCSEEHHSLAVFAAKESRLDHHCYEAVEWDLIRDWADHFASLHIPLKWGPGRHGPGNNLFVFIHDPDGNWLEISAELERLSPDRPVGTWPHAERTLNSWGIGLLRS